MSAQLAIVTGQQVEIVSGEPIEVSGAVLTARIAARSEDMWQVDGFDNSLIPGVMIQPAAVPPDTDEEATRAARAAAKSVFGQPEVKHSRTRRSGASSADVGASTAGKSYFSAQKLLIGQWKRGAVVYWPLDPEEASRSFHVEPDGSYAYALPGNTGPYHRNGTVLWVRCVEPERQEEPPERERTPHRYELVATRSSMPTAP